KVLGLQVVDVGVHEVVIAVMPRHNGNNDFHAASALTSCFDHSMTLPTMSALSLHLGEIVRVSPHGPELIGEIFLVRQMRTSLKLPEELGHGRAGKVTGATGAMAMGVRGTCSDALNEVHLAREDRYCLCLPLLKRPFCVAPRSRRSRCAIVGRGS